MSFPVEVLEITVVLVSALTSALPPGRTSLPSTIFLAGKGGGATTLSEGRKGTSLGADGVGATCAIAWLFTGGALATEESNTTTFPAAGCLSGGAVGKAGGWGAPSGTGALSAIFLGTLVYAKKGDLQACRLARDDESLR